MAATARLESWDEVTYLPLLVSVFIKVSTLAAWNSFFDCLCFAVLLYFAHRDSQRAVTLHTVYQVAKTVHTDISQQHHEGYVITFASLQPHQG
jgi:hypothetical protein